MELTRFPILEIFGPTIQGEGMVAGKKTVFIRTYGCDYTCVWCDSKFTWDGSQKPKLMNVQEIIKEVNSLFKGQPGHITISGGNPALSKKLGVLIMSLKKEGHKIGLETQGSLWKDWFLMVDDLTLSPKPPSSKMSTNYNVLENILCNLNRNEINYSVKIVIFDNEDLAYAKNLLNKFSFIGERFFLQVGNNDVNTDSNIALSLLNKYEWLCDKVIEDSELTHIRVLPQLHTLLWGNKQGV